MTDAHDSPTLDDVMPNSEETILDHSGHAKEPPRLDDDALEERTEEERNKNATP